MQFLFRIHPAECVRFKTLIVNIRLATKVFTHSKIKTCVVTIIATDNKKKLIRMF